MWDGSAFNGAKLALIAGSELLVYQRDDKPTIPHPGLWDLPGGGREGAESPFECARRETFEEFGISIAPHEVVWQKVYPALSRPADFGYFLVALAPRARFDEISFGDEGQRWAVMAIDEYLALPNAVISLQARLRAFLQAAATGVGPGNW